MKIRVWNYDPDLRPNPITPKENEIPICKCPKCNVDPDMMIVVNDTGDRKKVDYFFYCPKCKASAEWVLRTSPMKALKTWNRFVKGEQDD